MSKKVAVAVGLIILRAGIAFGSPDDLPPPQVIFPPEAEPDHLFGSYLSVRGGNVLIAATRQGAAHLYNRQGGRVARVTSLGWISGLALDDEFIYVSSLVSEKVYVIDRETRELSLTMSPPMRTLRFGETLAVWGDLVFVGAPYALEAAGPESGNVHVFQRRTGTLVRKLVPATTRSYNLFGAALAVDDQIVAVGTPADDEAGESRGAVYVFNGTTGVQVRKLLPSEPGDGQFGSSLAIHGGRMAVGSRFAVQVFDLQSRRLLRLGPSDPDPRNPYFARALAMNERWIAVGSQQTLLVLGLVRIFDASSGELKGELAAPDRGFNLPGANFGSSLALDGDRLIVGAPGDDASGTVYIYNLTSLVPIRLASFTAERIPEGARLAWVVAGDDLPAGFLVYREVPGEPRIPLTDRLLSGRRAYEFVDAAPPSDPVDYWLAEISRSGETTWYGPARLEPAQAPRVFLDRATPNPFTASTSFSYWIEGAMPVDVGVIDASGRLVCKLFSGEQESGFHALSWDGRMSSGAPAAAGGYLIRIQAGGHSMVGKVLKIH